MTGFDIAVIAVVLVSAILGMWRGLMSELLSLLAWGVAYVVALTFSDQMIRYVPEAFGSTNVRGAFAFAFMFIAVLIIASISAWIFAMLVRFAGLMDLGKKLGLILGAVRGVLRVLVFVWLAGLTNLTHETWWRDAWLSKPLQDIALQAKPYVPEDAFK
ncbi:MAG: CvpA family protein [Sideroxydans sp.]|nr:CvpA family protein [Sideroxydans sp.]